MKIEIFYFLPISWLDRSIAAIKDTTIIEKWWGCKDWKVIRDAKTYERAQLFCSRFKEIGYSHVKPWPIYERRGGGRIMYFMIHASDHPEAPKLMQRAYRAVVVDQDPPKQMLFEFN